MTPIRRAWFVFVGLPVFAGGVNLSSAGVTPFTQPHSFIAGTLFGFAFACALMLIPRRTS